MMSEDKDLDFDIARYFRSNLLACRRAIDPTDFKKFVALETNGERVAFILSYPEAHCLPLEVVDCPLKDMTKALKLKETGNKFFGHGDFRKALETYSDAVIITPRREQGIFLANRSAALYNLEQYELALTDIKEALNSGYPHELNYKLEERRAKCYLALGQVVKANDAFKKTLQDLDFAKIPLDKKKKVESDIRVMLVLIQKGGNLQVNEKFKRKGESVLPKLAECNNLYPACSSSVEIRDAGGAIGRHAIATRDIAPGELLMIERPHSTTLLGEYRLKNCHYCFRKNIAPYPAVCNTCTLIAYCGPRCRDADAKIHDIECMILGPLWLSDASITCLMAIKAVIQKPWDQLAQLKNDYEMARRGYQPTKERPFISSDFVSYWSLVTHEMARSWDDLFHRAFMAAWLLRLIKTTNYLPEEVKTPDISDQQLSDDEMFAGEILLHHLQLLQFNTHEVSELLMPRNEKTLVKSKNNFIGGGLYPTTALLNHSCNPGIVRYFIGTTMVVRAIRTIRAGNEICDNYGPIFTTEEESERQRKLRLRYWFDCGCEACVEHWPLIANINPRILRFRCETGPSCGNVLLVNTDSNEFMVHCTKCSKSTNIMKGLKALQDTDALFKIASNHLEEGENSKALKSYLEILKLLDETLSLPIKDYHLCQQGVRLTILTLGNTAVM